MLVTETHGAPQGATFSWTSLHLAVASVSLFPLKPARRTLGAKGQVAAFISCFSCGTKFYMFHISVNQLHKSSFFSHLFATLLVLVFWAPMDKTMVTHRSARTKPTEHKTQDEATVQPLNHSAACSLY